jgi:hypothetical protein
MTSGLEYTQDAELVTTIREGSRTAREDAFRNVFLTMREKVFTLCQHRLDSGWDNRRR